MSENKQYILQEREKGNVLISEDVIATIAAHAVSEVEGIASLSVKPGAEIVEMLGKKFWGKGIVVSIGENQEVFIDCNVVLHYGQSVIAVSQAVQTAVYSAVESFANLTIGAVNVNVCGIVRQ